VSEQKYHPLVFVAFWLAVFLLILPCQVDLVQSALLKGSSIEAIGIVLVTIAEVAAPLVYAQWRTRTRPEKYKPRLLSKITWAIIALNVVFNCMILTDYAMRAG
jgi:hypothetical protein